MTIRNYADILKFAIMSQVDYQEKEMQRPNADETFRRGVIAGLEIALEKIDASMFLAEK